MQAFYQNFGELQPKSLYGIAYRTFGSVRRMKRAVDKQAFGARVAQRRTELQIESQGVLADIVGMKQQGVGAIEIGHVARPRLLKELAAALRTTEEWLLWGEGAKDAGSPEPMNPADIPSHIRIIPEISWVSAGKFADVSSALPTSDVPLLAFSDLGRGDFFALKVVGDSMDRISPEGSKIIVDRSDRILISGKCYVFDLRGETTFKSWQAGETPYLEPLSTNPMNKPIFVKRKRDFAVVGRVKRTMLDM